MSIVINPYANLESVALVSSSHASVAAFASLMWAR